MTPARRELLASLGDAWGFLAEPYHLSDWWPGVVSVQPDSISSAMASVEARSTASGVSRAQSG